uniref:Uncharacterized protein n=1 Tax=Oryza meridionalis TaxID=40149 RepID=A0A0E0E6Y8_9ORYZ
MATRDCLLFKVHLAGELLVGGGRNQVLGGRRWSSKGSRIWRFRRQRRRCTDGDASTTITSDRSLSFLINKYSKLTSPTMEEKLQRLLLRVQIILEEA